MAKSRSRTLKGRGIGPSKVAPAAPMEEEEPMTEEETMDIDVTEDGAGDTFAELVGKTGWTYEDGDVTGVFDSVDKTITVIKVDGRPVRFVLDDGARTIESGEDLTREAGAAGEGGSRRRLKKKARRTKRNRRALKGKKLRKFTTRRR